MACYLCVWCTLLGDLILAEIYCVLGRFCGGMCCEREIMGMMERESWRSFLKCFLMWKGSLQGCLTHFCMSNYYWSFDVKMMRIERLTLSFRGRELRCSVASKVKCMNFPSKQNFSLTGHGGRMLRLVVVVLKTVFEGCCKYLELITNVNMCLNELWLHCDH